MQKSNYPIIHQLHLLRFNRILMGFIVVFTLAMASPKKLKACDVCGASAQLGSTSMGFSQSITRPLLGINFVHWGYQTSALTNMGNPYTTYDKIQSINLNYAHYIHPKVQIQLNWGVNHIVRNNAYNENQWESFFALNDLNFSLNYKLLDNRNQPFQKNKFLWLIGLNSKLPNGQYQIRDREKRMIPQQLQAGNGSYALGLQSFASWNINKIGLAVQTRISRPFMNELNYQPGINGGIQSGFYYLWDTKSKKEQFKAKIIPQLGLKWDFNQSDRQYGELISTTQMKTSQAFGQLELLTPNFYAQIFAGIPMNQISSPNSPILQPSIRVAVSFIINKKSELDLK